MLFWNSLAFSMIQWILAIWSLVPQPPLNPACTFGNPSFLYCWSLAWRILRITLLAREMSTSCLIVWTFFGIGMKPELFQSCGHCWVFLICWHIECSTLTILFFRIWNSSAGIPSHSPALFVVTLPKTHLT